MKLKYYLRGLGIGIVITAIIMSVIRKPEEITDAEIKMRAMKLGMVEESVLADLQDKKENVLTENTKENITKKTEGASQEEAEGDNISNTEQVENYIIISVESGNSSENVSRKLFEAGLVNSALEYHRFLIHHGYDRRIGVGNFEIPEGASEEEIAQILCGLK